MGELPAVTAPTKVKAKPKTKAKVTPEEQQGDAS